MARLDRWRRYRRFFGPDVEADVHDELAFHMEMRIRDYESRGYSRGDAERAARERFGDVPVVASQLAEHDYSRARRATRRTLMDRLGQDVRFALRGFRRAPGFFITAVLILAIGIGMSVAMFTVFRAVLVRRLPVVDQDRIAVMWTYREPAVELSMTAQDLAAVRRESRTMRDVAGVSHYSAYPSPLLDGERPVVLNTSMVTGNFFDVLGVHPALGRLLRSSDDDNGPYSPDGSNASKMLVLSYNAWQEKFGGDSTIVGRHLIAPLFRWEYTVVGVAPPGLDYPAGVDFWMPIYGGWASNNSVFAVGRLRAGVTIAAARDEYFIINNRLEPRAHLRGAHAATFTETVLGDVRPVLAMLMAAVSLLLLIACLNVGNLLLLRASSRRREIAVRRALGAGYGDIVRQLLVEAVALAVAGGTLGFLLAAALLRLLVAFAPPGLPRIDDIRLAGMPIIGAIAISSVSVLLFGVLPALFAARTNLAAPLRLDSRSGGETKRRRVVRQGLVASQVALAMTMLGGAALLARSLEHLERQDSGYVSDHLSILSLSWNVRTNDSLRKVIGLGDRLLRGVNAIPGVIAATPILVPPLMGNGVWQLRPDKEGQSDAEATLNPAVPAEVAGPDFFRTFGVPIIRGRAFTEADRTTTPLVVIVSETLARLYWPGQDPIGKRLGFPHATADALLGDGGWRTVVGVARDTHLRDIREASPTLYLPMSQGTWQGYLAVRSAVSLPALLPALGAAAHTADPQTVLYQAETMDQLLARPLSQPRLSALLMSSFGVVALLLAAIGLYGVMTALVRDQTREIGIRLALGATQAHVRREVLWRGAIVTGSGAVVGLAAALATSRLFTALLFRVSPTDPVALGGACLSLLAVGAVAAYLPARRATQIDPVQALRGD